MSDVPGSSPPETNADRVETDPSYLLAAKNRFEAHCSACHRIGGQGVEGRVPPLDGSPWVSGSEQRLIRIVLNGLRGPIEIAGQTYNLEMPAFGTLFSDAEIASLLTYVRHRYGAPSPAVATETVTRVRQSTRDQSAIGPSPS